VQNPLQSRKERTSLQILLLEHDRRYSPVSVAKTSVKNDNHDLPIDLRNLTTSFACLKGSTPSHFYDNTFPIYYESDSSHSAVTPLTQSASTSLPSRSKSRTNGRPYFSENLLRPSISSFRLPRSQRLMRLSRYKHL
jgi:hypothetical protein